MVDRKTRAKTGCLTCKQRRVKCDEQKPTCERCRKANVTCSGYEPPRTIVGKHAGSRRQNTEESRTEDVHDRPSKRRITEAHPPVLPLSEQLLSLPTPTEEHRTESHASVFTSPSDAHTESDLPEFDQDYQPHQRARDVLALQHYASKTTHLLFRPNHLYFWRDHLLQIAWRDEWVFDTIVAVGTMHRATSGLDTEVAAFQAYGNALGKVNEQCACQSRIDQETLIAVLLLLTCFECFAGNAASAFRHLRTARHYLTSNGALALPNYNVLIAIANELSLMAQIVLPVEHFPPYASSIAESSTEHVHSRPICEWQQLLDFVLTKPKINRAVWALLSATENVLDADVLVDFQERLVDLRASSPHWIDLSAESKDENNYSQIPPRPRMMPTIDATIATMLFNCYMAATSHILAKKLNEESERYRAMSRLYVHDNFRIIEGVCRSRAQAGSNANEMIKMGFVPILYLCATICESQMWRQWATTTLRSLDREGLYDGATFARALEVVDTFQISTASDHISMGRGEHRNSSFIAPILVRDVEGKKLVVYYAQELEHQNTYTSNPVKIVGRVRWSEETENCSKSMMIDFFEDGHSMNNGVLDECIYGRISLGEPSVQAWHPLFSLPV